MLTDHKDRYRVKHDACHDPFIPCRPNVGMTLDEAAVFDNGPGKFDVWIFQTSRPEQTAKAIIKKLATKGLAARISQMGDREVMIQVQHGGDPAKELAILKTVQADRFKDLSDVELERSRNLGLKFKGNLSTRASKRPKLGV